MNAKRFPCRANDRFSRRVHLALQEPDRIAVCACGLQVRHAVESADGYEWCDWCWEVSRGLRKPRRGYTEEDRTIAGRRSRMTAAAARRRREESSEDD